MCGDVYVPLAEAERGSIGHAGGYARGPQDGREPPAGRRSERPSERTSRAQAAPTGQQMRERNQTGGGAPRARARKVKRAALAALVLPVVVGGFMLQSAISENGRLFEEVLTRVAAYGVEGVPQDSLC